MKKLIATFVLSLAALAFVTGCQESEPSTPGAPSADTNAAPEAPATP